MTTDNQETNTTDRSGTLLSVDLDQHMLIRPHVDDHASALNQAALVSWLRSLYVAESRSVFRYLSNWQPYTNATTARLRTLVKKLSAESYSHADRLSVMLEAVGGEELREGLFREDNTHFNYTSWRTMLPRLIQAKAEVIQQYHLVLNRLDATNNQDIDDPVVDELRSLLEDNERHLGELKKWIDRV